MKRKFLTARTGLAALIAVLLCVCLAAGVWLTMPRAVYADEITGGQVEETEGNEGGEDETETPEVPEDEKTKNAWEVTPYISSWVYGSYNTTINTIVGSSEHGKVVFSILDSDENEVHENLTNFSLNNGTVPKKVTDKLATLNASRVGYDYILRATVAETAEYTGLSKNVYFRVIQATNSWLVAPAVLSWRYGEYDAEVNVINAVPAFGKDSVQIKIFEGSIIKAQFNLNADGTVPEDASETLSNLGAGDYYLLAAVRGTDNYTSLNDGALNLQRDGVKFSIFKITNNWKSTPNIIQWSWGSYDRNINLITAVPNYPQNLSEVNVKFGVYTDAACYDSDAVKGLEEFTVTAGVVDSSVARVLSRLNAGTYYLYATSEGTDNYTALNSIVQFSVQSIQNGWSTAPSLLQWTWGEFNRDVNVINAVPANGELANMVFGIYKDASCNEKVFDPFSYKRIQDTIYDADGNFVRYEYHYELDERVYSALQGLSAGTYYLKAELAADENGNYSALSAVVSFGVQSVQNHWLITPSVLAWKYGEYDKSVNLIQADSALGGDARIAIYHENGEPVLFSKDGGLVSSFTLDSIDGGLVVPAYAESVLQTLSVGTYYMFASVPADSDGNFSGLNEYTSVEDILAHSIGFTITAVENSWTTIPKILSWSEGHYDSEINRVIAEARYGNDKLVIRFVDSDGKVITSNEGGNELDMDAIANLSVGSYKIEFKVNGTNNYTALEGETTFAVFEDSVGLTGIIAAVIVFAIFDVFAAAMCIILLIFRRKKIEDAYRAMIRKELHRR